MFIAFPHLGIFRNSVTLTHFLDYYTITIVDTPFQKLVEFTCETIDFFIDLYFNNWPVKLTVLIHNMLNVHEANKLLSGSGILLH